MTWSASPSARSLTLNLVSRTEVAVMTGNLPVEQDILHLRAAPYVMDNQVVAGSLRSAIHHDADVRHVAAEIPCHKIAGKIIFAMRADREQLAFAREESH